MLNIHTQESSFCTPSVLLGNCTAYLASERKCSFSLHLVPAVQGAQPSQMNPIRATDPGSNSLLQICSLVYLSYMENKRSGSLVITLGQNSAHCSYSARSEELFSVV